MRAVFLFHGFVTPTVIHISPFQHFEEKAESAVSETDAKAPRFVIKL
jgi:hypothetical protein